MKKWDIPKVNLENVPSKMIITDSYPLPSNYDFGNDTGIVTCKIGETEYKNTRELQIGIHLIKCEAVSNHGKIVRVEKEVEVVLESGLDEVWDRWIKLNLYFPENSINWEWSRIYRYQRITKWKYNDRL